MGLVTLNNGEVLDGEALLIATGRKPNTQVLNSAVTGVELDAQGFIKIDDQFQTTHSGIYAIGDAAKQPAFTHVSWEDYRRLKAIVCGEHRTRNDRVLGYAVYTEPQVGRVGMTLEQAHKQGIAPTKSLCRWLISLVAFSGGTIWVSTAWSSTPRRI